MRPKPKGLGYLFVAGLEEEQRQERTLAARAKSRFFPFGYAQGQNDN
jgi:hypothetical protein